MDDKLRLLVGAVGRSATVCALLCGTAKGEEGTPALPPPEELLRAEEEVAEEQPDSPTNAADLRPVDGTWQTGMGVGLFFPSSELGLIGAGYQPAQFSSAAFEFFGRIGYFPKAYLGLEGEVATMLAGVGSEGAAMYAFRAHLVAQYPTSSVIPFGLVGVGALGAASGLTGHDIDFAFHFGAGLKFPLTPDLAMRFDLRENLSGTRSDSAASIAASEEVSFGIELTIGRPPRTIPTVELAPDLDGDRVPDELDSCPEEPALTADGCPMDSDEDGLPDVQDVCPTEAGLLRLRGCPEADPDSDGIKHPCDLCPDVPGKAPDGCPVGDSDEDGLLDDVDQCRDQPESPNGFRDSDGCPDEVPQEIQRLLGIRPSLQFTPGTAIVRGNAGVLDELARALETYPEVRLEIAVYARSAKGPVGETKEANLLLSQQRALALVQELVSRGISQARLEGRGLGEGEAVAPGAPVAEGERVEVLLGAP